MESTWAIVLGRRRRFGVGIEFVLRVRLLRVLRFVLFFAFSMLAIFVFAFLLLLIATWF